MEPTKRELREAKRLMKRKGNQRLRRQLKQTLAENPDEANEGEFDYGRYQSSPLNGMDHDATRRREKSPRASGDPEQMQSSLV